MRGVMPVTVSGSRRWVAAALGLALVVAPASSALAQAPALTPAQQDEWQKKHDQGKAAAQAEQWTKARDAYQGAWQIKRDWKIAANLGRAELHLGKYRDAAEHLSYFFREAPPNLATEAADEWNELRDLLAKAQAKVGRVVIAVEPAGAEVLVNGQPVGKSPLPGPVFVEPGQVVVEARAEGYGLGSAPPVKVGAAKEEKVGLKLTPAPGAKRVDPPQGLDQNAPDQDKGQPPPPKVNKATTIGGAAVAGVGLVLGGMFAGLSNAKASASHDLESPGFTVCPNYKACESQFNDLQQQKRTFSGVSIASFIAGGVGIGVLSYGLVTWKRAASVHVVTGQDRVGLSVSGAW